MKVILHDLIINVCDRPLNFKSAGPGRDVIAGPLMVLIGLQITNMGYTVHEVMFTGYFIIISLLA